MPRPGLSPHRRATSAAREASNGYDATARLSQLRMPTLVMHGRRDRVAPLALGQELHRAIPGSRLELFAGGHLFFLIREPARFLDAVSTSARLGQQR